MTIRDIFKLTIKLFGLYLFVQTTWMIFQYITILISGTFDTFYIIGIVLTGTLFIVISLTFIFKPSFYIDIFKLDSGFDQSKIEISSAFSDQVTRIGIVVISGVLIISNLSELFLVVMRIIGDSRSWMPVDETDLERMTSAGIKIVLGVLLLLNINGIRKWITKNKQDANNA